MPQINLTGGSGESPDGPEAEAMTAAPVPETRNLITALRDAADVVRDLKREIAGSRLFVARATSINRRGNPGDEELRSRPPAERDGLLGKTSQRADLRDSIRAHATSTRLTDAQPTASRDLRQALAPVQEIVQFKRLRERSTTAAQRQAPLEAREANSAPNDLRDALRGAPDLMRAQRLRERSEALGQRADRATLRGALRGADEIRRAWRLKERTLAGEARERRDELKEAGAGFRAFRQADALKRRTLAGEERVRDRAYRGDRAAAEYENSNRDLIARRQERAQAAQERAADRARRAAEQADTDTKMGRVRQAGLSQMVRDDRSNLGTVAAIAPAAQVGRALGGLLGTAVEAAEAVVESPRVVSDLMGKFVGGAKPYRDLVLGSSALGRAGGYDGDRLAGMWQPTRGQDADWRRLRGLTSGDLTSISSAYGAPARSAASQDGIAAAVADADLAPKLGGLGNSAYAEMLGTAQLLGLKGDGVFGQSGDPGRTDRQHGGAAYGYLRDWQRTMTVAVAAGMDRSVVRSSLEGLMRQSASSGAAEINAPKTADAWFRMASSGSPDARTGDEQASAIAGMTQQVEGGGLSGGVVPSAVFHSYLSRHGGLPRDAAGVAKLLGVDPSGMEPGEKRKFDDVVQAAQSGNEAVTFEYAKPFLYANQGEAWKSIVDQSGIAPKGSMHDLVAARLRGEPTGAYQDEQAGRGRRPARGRLGIGDVPDDTRRAIYNASDDTKVDSSILAGIFSVESGFDNSARSGTGAVGLGQITRTAITDLTGGDRDEAQDLWERSKTDSNLNAHLSARYYAELRDRYGSDHQALRHYHGLQVDRNGVGPDQYAARVEASEADYRNDPHRLRGVSTTQSDLNVQAAHQSETFVEGMSQMSDVLVSWNEKVIHGTDAVVGFTTALLKSTAALAGAAGSGQSHDLPAHVATHQAHAGGLGWRQLGAVGPRLP